MLQDQRSAVAEYLTFIKVIIAFPPFLISCQLLLAVVFAQFSSVLGIFILQRKFTDPLPREVTAWQEK